MKTAAWSQAIAGWLAWMRAAGRPATTLRIRRYQVQRLASDVGGDPWRVTPQQLIDWIAMHDWSPETRRSHRSAVVSFYTWAVAVGHVETSPALALPPIRPGQHRPRPAPDQVVQAGRAAVDPRVRLMVQLAALMGLRRGEISRVHTDDLVQTVSGDWSLLVHGKGAKDRLIPCAPELVAPIRLAGGWLFQGPDGHLSPDHVGGLMSGALPDGWTAHTLRHRFGTRAYAGSRDLLSVQQLMGHASPATTQVYVEVSDDALRRTMAAAA